MKMNEDFINNELSMLLNEPKPTAFSLLMERYLQTLLSKRSEEWANYVSEINYLKHLLDDRTDILSSVQDKISDDIVNKIDDEKFQKEINERISSVKSRVKEEIDNFKKSSEDNIKGFIQYRIDDVLEKSISKKISKELSLLVKQHAMDVSKLVEGHLKRGDYFINLDKVRT